jgi:hypothetical protein
VWVVVGGAAAGNGTLYEDDGESTSYVAGAHATTTLAYATATAAKMVGDNCCLKSSSCTPFHPCASVQLLLLWMAFHLLMC